MMGGRGKQVRDDGGCGQCLKYLMFGMNFLFFLFGATIMGVGIWIIVDRNFMSAILGTDLMTAAAYLIVVGGAIITVISLMGCLGAMMESKPLLLIYLIVLVLMFSGLLVAGILAIILKTEIRDEVKEYMREKLTRDYGVDLQNKWNALITDAWDNAQRKLYCCAVEDSSWQIYRQSEWYKIQPGTPDVSRPLVPKSCCERDQYDHYINPQKCQTYLGGPPSTKAGLNEALYHRGCYTAGYDYVMEYSGYLIGMSIGVAVALIAGIIFSLILFRTI